MALKKDTAKKKKKKKPEASQKYTAEEKEYGHPLLSQDTD